jgi:hypothetical protein
MGYTVHTEEFQGKTIKVSYDEDAESPRDWDNLGTMVCFHRRYNLGDDHKHSTPEDAQFDLFLKHATDEEKRAYVIKNCAGRISDLRCLLNYNGSDLDGMIVDIQDNRVLCAELPDFPEALITLPLYLYDHGGVLLPLGFRTGRLDLHQP